MLLYSCMFVSGQCGVFTWLFQAFLGVCCAWLGGMCYAAWRGVQGGGFFTVSFGGSVLGVHRVVGLGDEVRWSVRW